MRELNEAQPDEFLRETVNIVAVPFFAEANAYDDDKNPRAFNSVEDAVTLTDRAQAPKPDKFASERLALLFRVMREAVDAVPDLFPNPAVGNRPE